MTLLEARTASTALTPTSMTTSATKRPSRGRSIRKMGSWQAEKSQLTIAQIMEATLQCLVTEGYAGTTTEKIAKRAAVSRGATTHHFKSRDAIIKAAARYITNKRAEEFEEALTGVRPHTGNLPTLQDMRDTLSLLQRYYALPSFVAFHELIRGARTEKMLKRVLAPLERWLDEKTAEGIRQHFPYWLAMEGTREVLTDLITFSLQGVALDPAPYLGGDRLEHLLDLLATIALRELTTAYEASHEAGSHSGA